MAILGLVLLALTFLCSAGANGVFINEQCRPNPTLVPIDHPNYEYYPYIIKLHRCGGACGHTAPTIQKCVVVDSKNVTITLFDISRNKIKQVKVLNHTKCGCECVAQPSDCLEDQIYKKDSCECRCKYPTKSPRPCPNGYRWSGTECACLCHKSPEVCPVGKRWDSRACGCVCSPEAISKCQRFGLTVDDKCECKNVEVGANTGQQPQETPKISKLTLLLLVGEFVLLCVIFDAILCRWKAGFTYSIVQKLKCRDRSKDFHMSQSTIGSGRENATDVSALSEKGEKV